MIHGNLKETHLADKRYVSTEKHVRTRSKNVTRENTDKKLMAFAQVLELRAGPFLKVVQTEAFLELEPVTFV